MGILKLKQDGIFPVDALKLSGVVAV